MASSDDLINLDDQQSITTTINDMSNTSLMQQVHDGRNNTTINSTERSYSYRTTANGNEGIENNLVNDTITIVREKCKTLILTLRSPERRYYGLGGHIKPERGINRIIDELGDDLVRSVTEGVNGIRDEVKKARPSEDDPNYQLKIQVYKDLLEYVTNLIKELTNVFEELLTNYRKHVEQLWNDMQNASDWEQINVYIKQFETDSEKLFGDAVETCLEPYLNTIETKLNCMKK